MNQKKKENSEKELALFHAVLELIEENADFSSMTVSDITGKAGIGKGTAYEYFSSKEEMVAKAIVWAIERQTEKAMQMLSEKNSMEEQILGILDFIETEMCSKKCNIQLLKVLSHSCEMQEKLQQEFEKCAPMQKSVEKVVDEIISLGDREGNIAPGMKKTFRYTVIVSGLVSYFMFLTQNRETVDVTQEEMRLFLSRQMLAALKTGI